MRRIDWQKAFCYKEIMIGMILLIALLGLFILGPFFVEIDPTQTSLDIFFSPDTTYLLGTNDVGQDIFARLLAGGQNSLWLAWNVGILSTFLAVLIGTTAGLVGGRLDRFLMRTIDVLLVIPSMVILILVFAYLYPRLPLQILLISLLTWLEGARIVRVQVLSLKERSHVYAAKIFGARLPYIFFRHILPEMIPIFITLFLQGARRAIFLEAGLAFIGLVDPNVISWGSMISHALKYYYMDVWKWWLLPTIAALSASLISFTLLGYGLEEALSRRSERRSTFAQD